MDTKPTKPHPPKPKHKHPHKPYQYRESEVVALRLKYDDSVQLLLRDGRSLGASEFGGFDKFCYFLIDRTAVHKTTCIGVFPLGCEALVVSKAHPIREVSLTRAGRFNQEKLSVLYPEHRVGLPLTVFLVNGWELLGKIEGAGQFYVALQLSETQTVHLYRHAIADYEWVGGEPPAVSPEQAQKTKQQLKDLTSKPPKKSKVPPPPTPAIVRAPTEPPRPKEPRLRESRPKEFQPIELFEAMKEEAERTMVNAKIKIVLREIPVTVREVGNVLWIPLQNQPGGVPKGFELSPMTVDLVVSKKMWKNALKKAEEQKQQTGNEALYITEAIIGMHQNRFCALVSSIQVAESKPKTIEPKQAEDPKPTAVEPQAESKPKAEELSATPKPKVIETAVNPKPKMVEAPARPQPKTVEITFVPKAPETKQEEAPKQLEAKQATEEKPKEPEATAPETKVPKKRVFTATPDGIEEAPVVAEEKPAVIEVKAKSPKAKPRTVEVSYAPSSKLKK